MYTEYLVFSICSPVYSTVALVTLLRSKMFDLARKDMTEGRSKYFNFKFIRDLNI